MGEVPHAPIPWKTWWVGPPTSPKDYGNHYVFSDFGGGAGPVSPPTCDHYGQVVRKPDPDLVPNLVPTLCQAPPTKFSMGWGCRVLPPSPRTLGKLSFSQILREVGGSGCFPQPLERRLNGKGRGWLQDHKRCLGLSSCLCLWKWVGGGRLASES